MVKDDLKIGTIDDVQKLDIRTVSLNDHLPTRIAHQSSSHTFAVLTVKAPNGIRGSEDDTNHIRLYSDQTYELLSQHELPQYECVSSVLSTKLGADERDYFVVGTAKCNSEDTEPAEGRLLVFAVEKSQLELVSEHKTNGAVYSLVPFKGKLAAGVNNLISIFQWNHANQDYSLAPLATHYGYTVASFLRERGDFLVVGDLMKSVTLLQFKEEEGVLEMLARDYEPAWLTSLEALDDDTFLTAENGYNLFTVRKNTEATTEDERARLVPCGAFHLGEFVNKLQKGSLVMKMEDSESRTYNSFIYGGINGSLGVVATLNEDEFLFLDKLQKKMAEVVKGVGGFDHSTWRAFKNEKKMMEAKNFVDGDLIESFLDLGRQQMEQVVGGMDISVEEMCRRVETIARALH